MENININELKKDNLANVKVEKYVPIRVQKAMITSIVNNLLTEDSYGVYRYDPIDLEVMKTVSIISLFTNIDVSDDTYSDYDKIMELDLYYKLDLSDHDRIYEYGELLDMAVDSKMNENKYEYILAKKSDDIIAVFDKTMNHLNGMLDKGDPNKIAKYMAKAFEMFVNKMPDFSKIDFLNEIKNKKEK